MSQFPQDPFATPSSTDPADGQTTRIGPPAVAKWQIVYLILMMLVYVVVAVAGAALIIFRDTVAQDPDFDMGANEALMVGGIYAGLGVGLALLFLVGLFWRRGMGGWVFNLI